MSKKVVIVTGAASGIGFGTASKYIENDWSVALIDRNQENLDKAEATLKEKGGDVKGYVLDISDHARGKEVVDKIIKDFGRIDALFNNAGIVGHRKNILECDPEEIKEATNISLFGSLYMTQHVAGYWVKNGIPGAIVNISSIVAELASWDPFGYQISKYGVKGLTRTAAFQLGGYGIRVNAVAPGYTRTEMSRIDWENPETYELAKNQNLLHKWLEPEEIANVVFFLTSDESSAITGQIIKADAGYTVSKVDNRQNIYGE